MKKFAVVALLALGFSASLEATQYGFLYSNYKEPVLVTAATGRGLKSASKSLFSVLGAIGFGDAQVKDIAAEAGISKVKFVDKEVTIWPLGVFMEEKYTVYGD